MNSNRARPLPSRHAHGTQRIGGLLAPLGNLRLTRQMTRDLCSSQKTGPATSSTDIGHRLLVVLVVFVLVTAAMPAAAQPDVARMLPPGALRGNEFSLEEYPTLSLAAPPQRAAAAQLLAEVRAAARRWPTLHAARAAGFDTHTAPRRLGDLSVHFLHAENHAFSHDTDYLDPAQPEALIYANIPGWPLRLVGLMFAMPRGLKGPTPGGPITRWHTHTICAHGDKRGFAPPPGRACPAGTKQRQGGEMMHIWLTRDLRSAFAIHAPPRALGRAHLLPSIYCH